MLTRVSDVMDPQVTLFSGLNAYPTAVSLGIGSDFTRFSGVGATRA